MPDAIDPSLDELRRRARRRLVGAVVLALAAAVLVPMLLESEPKPLGEDVSVKIPPVDEGKFVSKIDKSRAAENPPVATKSSPAPMSPDAGTAAAAKQSSSAPPAARKSPEGAPPATPKAASGNDTASTTGNDNASGAASPPVTAVTPPKPATEQAPPVADAAKSAKPSSSSSSFSVQLAAFADDKGANALSNRLKKSGHPAYTEAYETSKGTLWRVRVGPYGTRDAAEAARAKLKADGQNGIIAVSN